MSLPSDSDYQTVLQSPRRAFADEELRGGVVEMGTGAMAGLPRPRAGNFATLYKVTCGEKSYAVRCFTRPYPYDLQSRYLEIERALEKSRLPYMADFSFLPRGIHVRGRWLPIVKMEWIQGESLERYVGRHLHEPERLFCLAAEWLDLLMSLRRAGIAHGDLQHGNVLVTDEGLRLVDYDGMCVSALQGRESNERGHANYQHPGRDTRFFDTRLDAFSGWVVWLSLVALAHEPSLWERFQGGDDCLLFRRRDFADPDRSPLFQALRASSNETLREYVAGTLLSLLSGAPEQVRAVEVRADAPAPTADAEDSKVQAHTRALERYIAPPRPPPRVFSQDDQTERSLASGLLIAAGLGLIPSVVFSPLWLTGVGLVGGLGLAQVRSLFHRETAVQEFTRWRTQWGKAREARAQFEARLARLRADVQGGVARGQDGRARLEQEQAALHEWMEDVRRRNLELDRSELDRIEGRHAHLDREELNARKDLEAERRAWDEDSELQGRLSETERREELSRFKQRTEDLIQHFDARREALEAEEEESIARAKAHGTLSPDYRAALEQGQVLVGQLKRLSSGLATLEREQAGLRRECIRLCWRGMEARRAMEAQGAPSFWKFLEGLMQGIFQDTKGGR
ncbi:hypothetical protein [Myxococcus landrumensis]|uniref:Protein kinase domain-containing protein n=1 Tax=Myxococcus landrumensis TaxID=2813577 RepID=A0ABX7NG56_9BACT|nr:hypothetical protein [Myxococcus landrumus]QSQ16351.1 hypothetical protein JY572_10010 [Myxococcus landrumus]